MKQITLLLLTALLFGCKNNTNSDHKSPKDDMMISVFPNIEDILKKANVTGSVLICGINNEYITNDAERASTAFLPASTFKIPNSIIALELGNAIDENTLLKWDGTTRNNENWNQDLTLADAYKYSCVPCYQALARKAGVAKMKAQLERIEYPGMAFDSATIDLFWLQGESRISQLEQIDFLRKLKTQQLPLKPNTSESMEKIMLYDKTDDYAIYAKTGMAIRDTVSYGWFVGYVETKNQTYYFATNIAPGEGMDLWGEFVAARIDVTLESLRSLDIID